METETRAGMFCGHYMRARGIGGCLTSEMLVKSISAMKNSCIYELETTMKIDMAMVDVFSAIGEGSGRRYAMRAWVAL